MPSYEIFSPDYQTYRFERELYSFNLIDYMFEDGQNKLWLSSAHNLKRANGYQFFIVPQLMKSDKHLKGQIIDGQGWNDSTQYLIEQADNQSLRSMAFTTTRTIKFQPLDSIPMSEGKLLFYDVLWNEHAYELWADSLQSLYLKITAVDGTVKNKIKIPDVAGTVTAFCVVRGQIWMVINHRKIISYELNQAGELLSPLEINSTANVNIFHSDRHDNIWVSRVDGIYQIRNYDSGYELTSVLAVRNMQTIFEDNHGNLVIGAASFLDNITSAYLFVREGGRWINLHSLIRKNQNIHFFAGHDFRKEIFIAAKNDLLTIRFSDHPLSRNIIDRKESGTSWNFIAKGLYKTDSTFYALAANQGLLIKDLITGKERLYHFRHPATRELLRFDCLRTIEVDKLGRLWFSTCENLDNNEVNFLIMYDPKTERYETFRYSEAISAIKSGPDPVLWVANQINGTKQRILSFDVRDQIRTRQWDLPENIGRINDIHTLGRDSLFLATDFGFYRYNLKKNQITRVPIQTNRSDQTSIFSIFHFDGKYFLAGRDGLFIYTPGQAEVDHYTMEDGLRNNIITAVFREKKNKYWLGTFYGIALLNLDENLIINYSTKDGLPENEFNLYSYFQDKSGYYLGYPNGVIRLDLRDSMVEYFEEIELDHALLFCRGVEKPEVLFPTGNHLNIPPDVTYFRIFPSSYASYFIDYYYYKLINTTRNDTTTFSAIDGVILSKLDAGTYDFKLKTYDRYGNILPGEKNFTVTVNQHFYQATWFRILLLLLGNAIIGYLIFYYFRFLGQKKRKAEDQAKRLSELELQVLQAQLNPHFIFNTISAIQYYIQDHDEERADMYLTSFSRLMRMYLDSSKSSYIPLNVELALLTNYIDLEIMVADGQIDAHYEIDQDLDLENTVIPTMTIQPFVENAIQHGLFHKKGQGNIYLRFIHLSDDTLLCEIEDDGIGRHEAYSINHQKQPEHKSRALQIINEKLEVLKATRDINIQIEIIDKYHESKAMGTLIQIKFPIILKENVSSLVRI